MTEAEIALLATYVRSLGRVTPERLTGSAEKGRTVYGNLSCASCHVIDGQGTPHKLYFQSLYTAPSPPPWCLASGAPAEC